MDSGIFDSPEMLGGNGAKRRNRKLGGAELQAAENGTTAGGICVATTDVILYNSHG